MIYWPEIAIPVLIAVAAVLWFALPDGIAWLWSALGLNIETVVVLAIAASAVIAIRWARAQRGD